MDYNPCVSHLNIEIKARSADASRVRELLKEKGAAFKGVYHQVDTYFNVRSGRLKLREGGIENYLIHYVREDAEGPKRSEVSLFRTTPGSPLKDLLSAALGVLVVVNKQREIYFMDNVKFHIDVVEGLGSFVEIEAIDEDGTIGTEKLDVQCRQYLALLGIRDADLIAVSYSDLLLGLRD